MYLALKINVKGVRLDSATVICGKKHNQEFCKMQLRCVKCREEHRAAGYGSIWKEPAAGLLSENVQATSYKGFTKAAGP